MKTFSFPKTLVNRVAVFRCNTQLWIWFRPLHYMTYVSKHIFFRKGPMNRSLTSELKYHDSLSINLIRKCCILPLVRPTVARRGRPPFETFSSTFPRRPFFFFVSSSLDGCSSSSSSSLSSPSASSSSASSRSPSGANRNSHIRSASSSFEPMMDLC